MSKIIETFKDHILKVKINRPEAHNAMDLDIIKGLTKIFQSVTKNLDIRVVLLEGEGPSFCAGGDLNWMRKAIKYNLAQNKKDAELLSKMLDSIFNCPVPVLAFVHGNVFGGGVGLAAVCDLVAAENQTKFSLSEVRLGLVPSLICPYVLRKIPETKAKIFMYTAEVFGAAQALESDLVHYVGTKDEAMHFLFSKARAISQNAPDAVRKTKVLVNKIKTIPWAQTQKLTIETIAKKRISPEGQEGIASFFEKRKPKWLGTEN